jgi:hypothetical protein
MTTTEEQQLIEANENKNQAQAQEQPATVEEKVNPRAEMFGYFKDRKLCLVDGDVFNLGL